MLKLKRVYEPFSNADGFRVLVDRLWPRGIKKENAQIDLWAKETAPSTELRVWYKQDVQNWKAFKLAYMKELEHSIALDVLFEQIQNQKVVTLLYASKDNQRTHALVLYEILSHRLNE